LTEAPSPQAPSPQAPSPQAPSPQAPSPQAPSPQAPSPQESSPQASLTEIPLTETPLTQASSPDDDEKEVDTKPLVFKSDEIVFGEDLGFVTQVVELPESEKRFHIDKQTEDIMNTMLSSIPNGERDRRVLDDIHVMISRFKELREEYSKFDSTNNTISPKVYDSNFKPLVESLESLDKKYYWILPVATIKKKLYDVPNDNDDGIYDDGRIKLTTTAEARIDDTKLNNSFIQTEQIKYKDYLTIMRNNFTPFIVDTKGKQVKTNMTAIIANLDDFETLVVTGYDNSVTGKRFFMQDYILAQDITSPQNNDNIDINSFVTLPDSVARFSRINAPSTNILRKTSLNNTFVQYWRMLEEKTRLTIVNVDVDTEKEVVKDKFLQKITHYKPENDISDPDKYHNYLKNIVPSTSQLFEHVKSHIEGSHSIHNTIRYLEPFAVDYNVINDRIYREMQTFVEEKIKEFANEVNENYNNLYELSLDSVDVTSGLELMFEKSRDVYDEIMDGYGIATSANLTDDEIYMRVMAIDNGRLLNIGIANISLRLMILHDSPCIEDYQQLAREKREAIKLNEETKEPDECNKYVISKKYLSLDELENDNNQDIFFDKRYDNTYYDLAKEYSVQLDQIEETESRERFLAEKLQEINGLSESKSMREAQAMLRNKREVIDGEYAVLHSEDSESKYYRRENNTWILDENIDEDLLTDETKLFCNFNERCIQKGNTCNSMKNEQNIIETEVEKQIIDEFENALQKTKNEHIKKIMKVFKKAKNNVRILRRLHQQEHISVNTNNNIFFGEESSMSEILTSPYEVLRNIILEQSDFAKKQSDIREFINNFTRMPYLGQEESPYWLYCIETNVKLLPSFYQEISQSFLDGLDYMNIIQKICDERGKKGDDGSVWVDKHSGYIITNLSFDTQEGYTEEGFLIDTRAILEDYPNIPDNINNMNSYNDEITILIMRVVDDMEKFMGIDLQQQQGKEFIRRLVKDSLRELLMKKNEYDKNNTTNVSYAEYKKNFILILSLAYLLIFIQTSIPQIKFGKQYPGCSRLFTGFPLSDDGDKGVQYISCVANKIKSSFEPWNTLPSNQNSIAKKIYKFLKVVVKKPEIKSRLENKRNYLKANDGQVSVFDDSTISKYTSNLLPVLIPVETETIQRTPVESYELLDNDMRTASTNQHVKINALHAKKIYVAMRILDLIEKSIKKETKSNVLLTTATQEPYVENACCWDDETRPFEYFTQKTSELSDLNNESTYLSGQLSKVKELSSARILFSSLKTKIEFPKISSLYSEETKYRALALLCPNNDIEITEEEQQEPICRDIELTTKTLDEKIKELENNGLKYTDENAMQLIASKNSQHIFEWKQDNKNIDDSYTFSEEINEFIQGDKKQQNEKITEMIEDIEDKKQKDEYLKLLEIIYEKHNTSVDNFHMITFSLNSLRYICFIIPNLLSSEKISHETRVPAHWQLSYRHINDIKKFTTDKTKNITNVIEKIKKYEMEQDVKDRLESYYHLMENQLLKTKDITLILTVFNYCMVSVINDYQKIGVTSENKHGLFSELIHKIIMFLINEMKNVFYDYNDLSRKINISKEKEKMNILKPRERMSEEQLEIDNQKKYNKLGEWGKGLQRNLRIYDKDEYDKEMGVLDTEESGELTDKEQQENDEIVMHDDDNPDDGEDGDEIY
jgi:hypothetical protein